MKRLVVLFLLLTPWVMHSMEQEVKPKEVSTETLLKRYLEGGGRWVKLVEVVLPGYRSPETGFSPSSRISQLIAQKILGRPLREFILSHVSLTFKDFVGHTESVWSAAFNPAGDKVITGSHDRTARIWNTATGELIHTLRDHISIVRSAEFNPAGDKVVTASYDGTAKIWSIATGKLIHTLEDHTGPVLSAAFNPAGDKVVIACGNKARIWNIATGEFIHTLKGHTGPVVSARFNPAGDKVVTASSDRTARISNIATGELLHTLAGHTERVFSATFNSIGDKIVTGSDDTTARIWNTATGELIHTLEGHTGPVVSATFSPAGDKVVTGSGDCTARIWNTATGELIHTLVGHTDSVQSATFNPAGDKVVTASYDRTARIWDVESLFSSEKFLAEDITLRQVAVLNDIVELSYVKALQKKAFEKGASELNPEDITFDFNHYPHLYEDYNALPEAIKGVFDPYVTKLSPSAPEQAPRGWCWPF